jgi:hypothetical protein
MVCQQLQFVTAMEVQQRVARQAVGAQCVQCVKRENALNKVFPQYGVVQATIFLYG